jgi:hypothetical protein
VVFTFAGVVEVDILAPYLVDFVNKEPTSKMNKAIPWPY